MARNDNRLTNGSQLGPYKIIRLIGEGGMGEVYEATDEILNRRVALKVISPELSKAKEIIKRFRTEGQTLARLSHQNVVAVHTLGEDKGTHYIVMEFIDGHSLSDLVKMKGALEIGEAIHYFKQLLLGVEALHEHGIIHRDIKPKNIIIRKDNSVKIVDFGIAKIQGQPERELTVAGELLGSIYYIAPEVIDGEIASIQSDIWSLGINLYEMLMGERPFEDEKWSALVHKITSTDIVFPIEEDFAVPDQLQRIICKMCEKLPSRRYRTVGEVLRDLEQYRPSALMTVPGRMMAQIPDTDPLIDQEPATSLAQVRLNSDPKSNSNSNSNSISSPNANSISGRQQTGTLSRRGATALRRKQKQKYQALEVFGLFVIVLVGAWLINHSYQKYWVESESTQVTQAPLPAPTIENPVATADAIVFKPASPLANQSAWLSEQSSIQFAWSGKADGNTILEVARDAHFQDVVLEASAPTSPFTIKAFDRSPLEDGKYFWRLARKSGNGKDSHFEAIPFTIATTVAPNLIYPVGPKIHSINEPVNFYWQEKPGMKSYRFQIAFDKNFQSLYTNQLIKEAKITFSVGEDGSLFWRVRAESDTNFSAWSEARPLRIQKGQLAKGDEKRAGSTHQASSTPPANSKTGKESSTLLNVRVPSTLDGGNSKAKTKPVAAPKITKAIQKFVLRLPDPKTVRPGAENLVSNPPTLAWTKANGASSYEVQVSKYRNFSQLEWSQMVLNSQTKWTTAQPGKYYWRVRAVDGAANKSNFSNISALTLVGELPKEVKVAKENRDPSSPKVAVLDFQNPKMDRSSKVLVSGVSKNVPGNEKIEVPDFEAPKSAIPRELASTPPPEPLPPPTPALEKAPKLKLPPNGTSIVSLNGVQSPISFKWEKQNAQSYRLEISKNERFTQVIHSAVVRENSVVLTETMPVGKLYWRLRSENGNTKSEWSQPFTFEVSK